MAAQEGVEVVPCSEDEPTPLQEEEERPEMEGELFGVLDEGCWAYPAKR